jgi:hypothetical protein
MLRSSQSSDEAASPWSRLSMVRVAARLHECLALAAVLSTLHNLAAMARRAHVLAQQLGLLCRRSNAAA